MLNPEKIHITYLSKSCNFFNMRLIGLLIAFFFVTGDLCAQYYENTYRPGQQRYELVSPHFRIIFPAGEYSVARATAQILEDQYSITKLLVGGSVERFPVVLNNHSDRGNGFVSPLNFRTEIEIPITKSLTFNSRSGGWMEFVAPHELVHILHFSNIPRNSFAGLVRLISPDIARSMHAAAPFGMLEGIAVYHESNVMYQEGGRGNYPFFTNRTLSVLNSDNPWSLAQHLHTTRFSRPLDRHYAGGYQFIAWLQARYGPDTTRKSIEYFIKYPVLGYGLALRHATGKMPDKLFREYLEDQQTTIDARHEMHSQQEYDVIELPFKLAEIRSPVWLDSGRLLFAAPTQLNARPGFYVFESRDSSLKKIYETHQVQNYNFHYLPESGKLYFSRYHNHAWQTNGALTDAYELDIQTGKSKRLTFNQRLHSPFFSGGELHGLQTHHETSQWVVITKSGETKTILSIYPDNIEAVVPAPDESRYAIIATRNGVRALWLVKPENAAYTLQKNPDIGFINGSVLDASWSNDGKRLYFSADPGEVVNIFKYNSETNQVHQITDSKFNAFQPRERPDGLALAFVTVRNEQQLPAILHRNHFLMRRLHPAEWHPDLTRQMQAPRMADYLADASKSWEVKPYKTGASWLRPRILLPITLPRDGFIDNRFGISAEGTDILGRHAWRLDVSTSNNHLWADAAYKNTTFYPGYELLAFYRPVTTASGLVLERGGNIRIPFFYRTETGSRSSWFRIRPGFKYREIKIDLNTVPEHLQNQFRTDWLTDKSITAFAAYYHRIQQNFRDIQPNTGTIVFWQGEHFVGTDRAINPSGMRGGLIQYFTPFLRYNHGVRLSAEVLTQTKIRIYNTSGLVYQGFGTNVLAGLHNAGSLSFRYVLPLSYIEDGWITVPLYFERVYLAMHANSVFDLNTPFDSSFLDAGRAVFGLELRTDIRFFNLDINLGFGVGWEATRNQFEYWGQTSTF